MLTVPESIKELLHRDSCQKNIRIHFPNGERSDICNDLIVKDSVSFTESLCSQDQLKFGLCESPVFECETVGVGNIKGATIEVSCEVYCDASVTGAEWRVDLQHHVYPIRYGIFKVSEAKRQADMIHRRIVAYFGTNINDMNAGSLKQYLGSVSVTSASIFLKANNQEVAKDAIIKQYNDAFTYDPFKRIYSRMEYIEDDTVELTEYVSAASGYGEGGFTWYANSPSNSTYVDFKLQLGSMDYPYSLASSDDNLYLIQLEEPQKSVKEIYEWACENLRSCGMTGQTYIEAQQLIYHYLYDSFNFVNYIDKNYHRESDWFFEKPSSAFSLYGHVTWFGKGITLKDKDDGHIFTAGNTAYICPLNREKTFIYPYNFTRNAETFGEVVPSVLVGIHMKCRQDGQSSSAVDDTLTIRDGYRMKIYQADSEFFGVRTMTQPRIADSNVLGAQGYVLDESVNDEFYQKFLISFMELRACFAYLNRDNFIKVMNINQRFGMHPADDLYPDDDLYPEGVTGGKLLPQDYQSCWYDDDYTKPFGAIQCKYKNTVDEDCFYTMYFNGCDETTLAGDYRAYDLSDNFIIQSFKWTENQIIAIMNDLAVNIANVQYMPVEFVGRGLPYVEAGDTFEILTKSSDSITTIVLNRTITGEMTLTDSYKSV